MTSYPRIIPKKEGAIIASVAVDSPAGRAQLNAGDCVLSVDGEPLRDILDWYWLADDYEIELEIAADEDSEQVTLHREPGESWGVEFDSVIFDGLRSCHNTCCFCFMKMLPEHMRPALYVRDDDYRLSFLHGNFVTLTNVSDEDVARIIQLHLSPLNVSLHALDPMVREHLMGKNHARGIEVLEQLLAAGIEFKAQIVLMPEVNDGHVLDETLAWIQDRSGIVATGIVPYGYTRFATLQQGFDTAESAKEVIKQVLPRAPQVQLADEFFIKAWPGEILSHLPEAEYYGEYPLIADGIGMVRAFLDNQEALARVSDSLGGEHDAFIITGQSFAAILREHVPQYADKIIAVKNRFFGGNVDVAGLLTAEDVVNQVKDTETTETPKIYLLPPAMFNDDGLTLDNKTAADIVEQLGASVKVLDFTEFVY